MDDTQGVPLRAAARARILGSRRGWLLEQKELFSQWAPGNTCIGALMIYNISPVPFGKIVL